MTIDDEGVHGESRKKFDASLKTHPRGKGHMQDDEEPDYVLENLFASSGNMFESVLTGEDGVEIDLDSLRSPWDLASELPALPAAPDMFADRNSSDFDPRPAIAEVTEDDWAPELQQIFVILKKMIRDAVNVNTKPRPREHALRWLFVPDCPGPLGLDFLDTCGVFATRPLVLHTRILHQLWIGNIPLREPLPDEAAGLPMTLASEIQIRMGAEALSFARMIWRWPGIRADELKKQFPFEDPLLMQRAMNNLEANGYIALRMGFWYFISRNFEMMTPAYRRTFSWAQSFIGDE